MRDPGVSREGERPIDYLNRAIISFKNQIVASRDINASVEISFITFNDKVEVIQPFRNADRFNIPALIAYGNKTAMNEAIEKALDIIEIQKKLYRDEDIEYYRPYLFLFSDGIPTDKDREEIAKSRIKEAILGKHVIYCPVAIGDNADVDVLCSYFPDSVKKMVIQAKKGQLDIVFEYLSDSISESVLNDGYVDTSDLGLARGLKIIKR